MNELATQAQTLFLNTYKPQGLTSVMGMPDGTHSLTFAEGSVQANIDAVNAAAATFDWTGVSIPFPDVVGFFTAIAESKTLPTAATTTLPLAEDLMVQQINNPSSMNNYIANMVTSGAYPWLTLQAIEEILTLAAQYNIPISAPVMPEGVPNLTGFKLAMVADMTYPPAAKLELFKFSSTLTDLIGYESVSNPVQTLSTASVQDPTSHISTIVLDVIDPSFLVGGLVVITDGTNKEVVPILSISGNTITAQLVNVYAAGATAQVPNLLVQAWLLIASSDSVVQVACSDGVLVTTKVPQEAAANGIVLVP